MVAGGLEEGTKLGGTKFEGDPVSALVASSYRGVSLAAGTERNVSNERRWQKKTVELRCDRLWHSQLLVQGFTPNVREIPREQAELTGKASIGWEKDARNSGYGSTAQHMFEDPVSVGSQSPSVGTEHPRQSRRQGAKASAGGGGRARGLVSRGIRSALVLRPGTNQLQANFESGTRLCIKQWV
ncbi:hypothetical protein BGX38DRAFT_709013 [Terfezia claveryi]|nr:hypothetical protein BGX38DRAFT_709013 [Terfezia claveryi]